MGLVWTSIKFLTFITTNIILVLFLAPENFLIPPAHIHFKSYSITPAKPLKPNSLLDKAEPLKLNRELSGPESLAIRNDEIFAGLRFGEIVKIKDGKATTVAKTGLGCEGYWDEKRCGRPLGLRFDNQGKLLVADGSRGLLRVDVDSGLVETLTSSEEVIDGKQQKFMNDLDIDKDGNIYYSVCSTNVGIEYPVFVLFGEPSGRLMKYDVKKKKSEVLVENVHMANGIQLSKNEDFIMVSEFARARVMRYFLKGPKQGQFEVFLDGIPGQPDNIRPNGKGGYYVSLYAAEIPDTDFNPLSALAERPWIRRFILRIQHLLVSIVNLVRMGTGPNIFMDKMEYKINNLGMDPDAVVVSSRVCIIEFDESGKILGTLQNKNSNISVISQVNVGPEYTYFGTPLKKLIWRMKTKDLHQ